MWVDFLHLDASSFRFGLLVSDKLQLMSGCHRVRVTASLLESHDLHFPQRRRAVGIRPSEVPPCSDPPAEVSGLNRRLTEERSSQCAGLHRLSACRCFSEKSMSLYDELFLVQKKLQSQLAEEKSCRWKQPSQRSPHLQAGELKSRDRENLETMFLFVDVQPSSSGHIKEYHKGLHWVLYYSLSSPADLMFTSVQTACMWLLLRSMFFRRLQNIKLLLSLSKTWKHFKLLLYE